MKGLAFWSKINSPHKPNHWSYIILFLFSNGFGGNVLKKKKLSKLTGQLLLQTHIFITDIACRHIYT